MNKPLKPEDLKDHLNLEAYKKDNSIPFDLIQAYELNKIPHPEKRLKKYFKKNITLVSILKLNKYIKSLNKINELNFIQKESEKWWKYFPNNKTETLIFSYHAIDKSKLSYYPFKLTYLISIAYFSIIEYKNDHNFVEKITSIVFELKRYLGKEQLGDIFFCDMLNTIIDLLCSLGFICNSDRILLTKNINSLKIPIPVPVSLLCKTIQEWQKIIPELAYLSEIRTCSPIELLPIEFQYDESTHKQINTVYLSTISKEQQANLLIEYSDRIVELQNNIFKALFDQLKVRQAQKHRSALNKEKLRYPTRNFRKLIIANDEDPIIQFNEWLKSLVIYFKDEMDYLRTHHESLFKPKALRLVPDNRDLFDDLCTQLATNFNCFEKDRKNYTRLWKVLKNNSKEPFVWTGDNGDLKTFISYMVSQKLLSPKRGFWELVCELFVNKQKEHYQIKELANGKPTKNENEIKKYIDEFKSNSEIKK